MLFPHQRCGNNRVKSVDNVCGRFARSAFLFTGSPRFARDESEYVKTSNAKFEQLRGYPQASAEGIRVYEVKRSANRINTRIRTGRNAPERHTHESRVNHPGLRPPIQWRGTGYVPLRNKVPYLGGVARFARRGGLFHGAGLGIFIRAGAVCIGRPHWCIHNA